MTKYLASCLAILLFVISAFTNKKSSSTTAAVKTSVIFDTDANNEVDDQHALAYLLFNGQNFAVEGVTVNATKNGGDIDEQYAEAERILKLTNLFGKIPLLKGANAGYNDIKQHVSKSNYDGYKAVDFIIQKAKQANQQKLVLIAVGKLTNVALALHKEPSIAKNLRVVWLGANYPEPGEYNQDNDTAALNYVLNTRVPFEMVTVRYGKPSGTDAVKVTQEEINKRMPGKGPKVSTPVTGRHKEAFTTFGDYSVNLFQHIKYHGNPPSRALFDMAAVAIVKDPSWANVIDIPAPILQNNAWVTRPTNPRKIKVWENFKREEIMQDFYQTMEQYVLAGTR
jgi:inosine-uridine nucleoside N-ribohydrolase